MIAAVAPLHDWWYLGVAFFVLTLSTIATRAGFFLLPGRYQLPAGVEKALRFAPACALAAIIAQGVLTRDHRPYLSADNDALWGLVAAGATASRTRNMILIMCAGMGVFTALRLWT